MKTKLLGLILFWGLFACSVTASDSISLRQKAQHATEEGNYEEAYQTYQKLSNQYDSIYQHVYGKEIEDLRATYVAICSAVRSKRGICFSVRNNSFTGISSSSNCEEKTRSRSALCCLL